MRLACDPDQLAPRSGKLLEDKEREKKNDQIYVPCPETDSPICQDMPICRSAPIYPLWGVTEALDGRRSHLISRAEVAMEFGTALCKR